jgi:hypothetical protein
MASFKNKINLLYGLFFFLEIIFKSSGVGFLSDLALLVILFIINQEFNGRNVGLYLAFILLTVFIEAISLDYICMTAFFVSIVYLFINLIGLVINQINKNRKIKILLILLFYLILEGLTVDIMHGNTIKFDLVSILLNLVILFVMYQVISKINSGKYVI